MPAAVGFVLGAAFVWAGDQFTSDEQLATFAGLFTTRKSSSKSIEESHQTAFIEEGSGANSMRRRGRDVNEPSDAIEPDSPRTSKRARHKKIRRVLLLVFAITVHNLPEGMAV